MNGQLIERHFASIGARAKVAVRVFGGLTIAVLRDSRGEYFDIAVGPGVPVPEVVDVQPSERRLLVMSRHSFGRHKFLCGHDARHWFVAAVPEKSSASTAITDKEVLKPRQVRGPQRRLQLKVRERNRRRNEAFIRQGEWILLPFEELIDDRCVLRNDREFLSIT